MSEAELIGRLEKLGRDNRRLKRFVFFVLVVTTALATIYAMQPVPQKMKAHEFDMVDSSGKVTAVIKNRTIEAEQFILRDSQGRARIIIGTPKFSGVAVDLGANDPAIWISDEKGMDRAILTADGLRFADRRGRSTATFAPSQ